MTNDELQNSERTFDLKERTKQFALRVIKMYVALPKSSVGQVLGKQVLRSGTSVGANYREADRVRSKAEFVAKMGDSLRELKETSYWLELLIESDQVPEKRVANLLLECREIIAIFSTIIRKSKQ